jgi:hypothetical protein
MINARMNTNSYKHRKIFNILMENLEKHAIPLKEICSDMSKRLADGFDRILIISPSAEQANLLLNEMTADDKRACEVRIYSYEKYAAYRKKTEENSMKRYMEGRKPRRASRTYKVELHNIELTQ